MNFEVFPDPRTLADDKKHGRIVLLNKCKSLQELIYFGLACCRRMVFCSPPDGRGAEIMVALDDASGDERKPVGFTAIEMKAVRDEIRVCPLDPTKVQRFDDCSLGMFEEKWRKKRDAQLGLRWSKDFGEWMVPAAKLPQLMMSYLLEWPAMVQIDRKMAEDRSGYPKTVYRIELQFLGDLPGDAPEDFMFGERYILPREKMEKFLLKSDMSKDLALSLNSGPQGAVRL